MSIFRIGNNVPRINDNLFGIDFDIHAGFGTIYSNPAAWSYNFNLYVPVFNSGFSNSFYVCAYCSGNTEYAVTGSTQIINKNTGYTWTLVDKINSEGAKTIWVDLYCNNVFSSRYTYNIVVGGGEISYSGNYVIHSFKTVGLSNISFDYYKPIQNIEIMMIGGGGGAGTTEGTGMSGAGGAGVMLVGTLTGTTSGTTWNGLTIPITVGGGGNKGVEGGDTLFYGISAPGGGHGDKQTAGSPGASGGGTYKISGSRTLGGVSGVSYVTWWTTLQFLPISGLSLNYYTCEGGDGATTGTYRGGGGGGAESAGGDASYGYPGSGKEYDITGSVVRYARGGGNCQSYIGIQNNTGNGGEVYEDVGGYVSTVGSSGIVVIRYLR